MRKSATASGYEANTPGDMMTELERERIVEQMYPDWREHLNDGKLIDDILDKLSGHEIALNSCSRPSCHNVARPGLKTCRQCAAKAAQYMRGYARRRNKARKRELGHLQQISSSQQTPD